jgi:hypothetical protein
MADEAEGRDWGFLPVDPLPKSQPVLQLDLSTGQFVHAGFVEALDFRQEASEHVTTGFRRFIY